MNGNISLYKKFYLLIIACLSVLITATPYLIREGISYISEETLETVIIFLLLFLGFLIFNLYQKEVKKLNLEINDNFKYIGKINVHFDQLDSLLKAFNNFPFAKKELKQTLTVFLTKALAVVDADWIYLRIVDTEKIRTLAETFEVREMRQLPEIQISNKELIGHSSKKYLIFCSSQKNIKNKVFLVLPKIKLERSQETLLQLKVDYLSMVFSVYHLSQFKNQA
jgi:hypothetical protein